MPYDSVKLALIEERKNTIALAKALIKKGLITKQNIKDEM